MNRWMAWCRRFGHRCLRRRGPVLRCPRPVLPALPELEGDSELPATDAAASCGWFDSSWDLQHGLAVIEGPALDPLGLYGRQGVGA